VQSEPGTCNHDARCSKLNGMDVPSDSVALEFLRASRKFFLQSQTLGSRALEQVPEAKIHHHPDESNSLAVIVKHMAGNMRSRWSNLFGNDGETATRDRDAEFTDDARSKAEILEEWAAGWNVFFTAFDALEASDLKRTITIRGESISVIEALQRQMAHYAHHTGQIVYLAKALVGPNWQSLSIPKGESAAFNQQMLEQNKGQS
jgi:uncharacterized damage-inducible protein DinB